MVVNGPLKHHRLSTPLRQVALLTAIPLALTSSGYALYSQQLSVHGNATEPVYTSSQNLSISYTKSTAQIRAKWKYTITVIVKYNGTGTVTAWNSAFSLPADFSNISCANANCTQASATNTAVNKASNGTINPGGTVTYTLIFRSASATYRFTNISISGTLAPVYAPVAGLTVAAVGGTQTKSGKWFNRPYAITVTNNSGQNLPGWRMIIPWSTSTNKVTSMPATVNYTQTATQLNIFSTQAINTGTTFQFTPTLGSTSSTWVMSGYTIEGLQ